jgi:hypothetical protein
MKSSRYQVVEHNFAEGKLLKKRVAGPSSKTAAQNQADKLNEAQASKEVENTDPNAPIISYLVEEA